MRRPHDGFGLACISTVWPSWTRTGSDYKHFDVLPPVPSLCSWIAWDIHLPEERADLVFLPRKQGAAEGFGRLQLDFAGQHPGQQAPSCESISRFLFLSLSISTESKTQRRSKESLLLFCWGGKGGVVRGREEKNQAVPLPLPEHRERENHKVSGGNLKGRKSQGEPLEAKQKAQYSEVG